ncbi:F-box/WD repeat-containing protein 9 [Bulinus truncatus]|nr:F-box/WD repeat-containing protein 9 [Bulinus truncatus]
MASQINDNLLELSLKGSLTLDQLDDDVLFHIATFLEARVVKYALSQVCKRFQTMFDNETYWKMRITVRWPKKYPAVACSPDFLWDEACVMREDMHRIWSDVEDNTQSFMYTYNIYGGVDSVHLIKNGEIVVVGDRNRSLNLIDLTKYPGADADDEKKKQMLVNSNKTAHEGWIWSIASLGSKVITGSWDNQIRIFDAEAGCSLISTFKCKSPVLSLYADDNEIVASCFDKNIYFIDPRTLSSRTKIVHTKPVLCVTGSEKFILSGSEDKSISIFDRRADKVFKKFKLDKYPLCMSYRDNQLWLGDVSGSLHLHDGTDDVFQHIGTYDVGHTEKMTGVIYTPGAIFTSSGDKTIKVLEPTREPNIITSMTAHKKEIAEIDYKNGVLVSAGGDDCLGVWLAKHFD